MNSKEQLSQRPPIDLPVGLELCDPAPELARLREREPLCRLKFADGAVGWLVTSYSLGREVLVDRRLSVQGGSSPLGNLSHDSAVSRSLADTGLTLAAFLGLDPPQHTRFRRLLAGHFTRGAIQALREPIEQVVLQCIERMQDAGSPSDLVREFASPIGSQTQCLLLGLPTTMAEEFARISVAFFATAAPDQVLDTFSSLATVLRTEIGARRLDPKNDLISYVATNGGFSDDEILSLVMFVFIAGLGTTEQMLAFAVFVLLCNPQQMLALREGSVPIEQAVEELLRFVSVTSISGTRVALEDVELGGELIRAGEYLVVSQAAANRDEDRFGGGDQLDLQRLATGHLAFGHGIHVCLGQHLVRLELSLALRELVSRFPSLRLEVPPGEVPLFRQGEEGSEVGVHALPVTW